MGRPGRDRKSVSDAIVTRGGEGNFRKRRLICGAKVSIPVGKGNSRAYLKGGGREDLRAPGAPTRALENSNFVKYIKSCLLVRGTNKDVFHWRPPSFPFPVPRNALAPLYARGIHRRRTPRWPLAGRSPMKRLYMLSIPSSKKLPPSLAEEWRSFPVINTPATIKEGRNCEHFPGRLTKYRSIYHERASGLLLRISFLFVSAIIVLGLAVPSPPPSIFHTSSRLHRISLPPHAPPYSTWMCFSFELNLGT